MKCKFCVHWDDFDLSVRDPKTEEEPDSELHKCNKIKHLESSLEWNEDYTDTQLKDKSKRNLAFVEDASGYFAMLVTSPNFGCVHFEKRHLQ